MVGHQIEDLGCKIILTPMVFQGLCQLRRVSGLNGAGKRTGSWKRWSRSDDKRSRWRREGSNGRITLTTTTTKNLSNESLDLTVGEAPGLIITALRGF
jgi:hypothetical protein